MTRSLGEELYIYVGRAPRLAPVLRWADARMRCLGARINALLPCGLGHTTLWARIRRGQSGVAVLERPVLEHFAVMMGMTVVAFARQLLAFTPATAVRW